MIKKILFKLPEYYFIIMLFLAGFTPPFYVHYLSLIFIAVLVLQIVFKNKTSGLLLGGIAFFGNLFFLAALFSEFNDFTEFNSEAQRFIIIGITIWVLNLIASVTIIYRYVKVKTRSNQRIKYY